MLTILLALFCIWWLTGLQREVDALKKQVKRLTPGWDPEAPNG